MQDKLEILKVEFSILEEKIESLEEQKRKLQSQIAALCEHKNTQFHYDPINAFEYDDRINTTEICCDCKTILFKTY